MINLISMKIFKDFNKSNIGIRTKRFAKTPKMKNKIQSRRAKHQMQQMLLKRNSKRTIKQTPVRPMKPTMKKNSSSDQGRRKVHIKMIISITRTSRSCCCNNNSWENRYRAIRKATTQRTKSSEIIWISCGRLEIQEDPAFLLSKA